MRQFFVNKKLDNFLYLDEKDIHHASKVLHLDLNKKIICIFQKKKFLCQLVDISKKEIICEIIEELDVVNKPYKITIFLPITKQKKWDLMVEKLTELDCDAFVPVVFGLCQKNEMIRIDRLERIIKNSCEQSNRNHLPVIDSPIDFQEMIEDLNSYELVLLGDERYRENHNFEFKINLNKINNFALIIGPSGGFTESEFKILENKVTSVKLGKNILRTETAAITIINFLHFLMEFKINEKTNN